MVVYVLSKSGKKLMPTRRFGKVRKLLKTGKARVISRRPFAIQLLYDTTEYVQDITVGIDPGKTIGFAIINKQAGKVIQKGEIRLRDDISRLLRQRAEYRRGRRYRKTRYRKPRFLNRRRPENWLPPSVKARLEHTVEWIKRLTMFLPENAQVVVEIAKFDIQKIQNPNISGEEYQRGKLYGYENVKQYLIARENGRCQLCGKGYDGNGWHIHHIIPRSEGGSDRPDNLALLHKKCHEKLHKNFTRYSKKLKRPAVYKELAYLNMYRKLLINKLKEFFGDKVIFTYGAKTVIQRHNLGLPRAYYNNALAMTGIKSIQDISELTVIRQVRKKKRSLHEATPRKGRKTPNREAKRNNKNTKEVILKDGRKWSLWDKVKVGGQVGFISGFTGNSYAYVQDMEGDYIRMPGKTYKQVSLKQAKLIKRNNNWIEIKKAA